MSDGWHTLTARVRIADDIEIRDDAPEVIGAALCKALGVPSVMLDGLYLIADNQEGMTAVDQAATPRSHG